MTFPFEKLALLNIPITRLVMDSRAIQSGDTFVACPGESEDGRQFISSAIEQGANAIIWESQHFVWSNEWKIPNLGIADLRHKVGWLADAVYGSPSENLWSVGITGTNGKTSICHWIAQTLSDNASLCAMIGTLGNGFNGNLQATLNTTPDAISVHGLLADYLRGGAKAVAMEVSSHALVQGRVCGVHFDVAVLTNLSRDHLDYHGDMESYAASKRKLFEWGQLKYAVLNLDDEFGAELAMQLQDETVEVIGYGMSDDAMQFAGKFGIRMVYGHLSEMSERGLQLDIHTSWGGAQLNSELIGRFNATNLLGVLAVLLVSSVGMSDAIASLSKVQAVAGRMQRFGSAQQPMVIVDYAHTPDALEKVLLGIREISSHQADKHAGGRLICVFGCGGGRDRGKRAMMGKVAKKFSDYCIVTSDNPRSENPRTIIADIASGMDLDGYEIMVDRASAIQSAIRNAQQNDIVLIAGKGHEAYQEINGIKHPFSDEQIALQTLKDSHFERCL